MATIVYSPKACGSCGITPQSDLTHCAEYDLNVLRSHLPEFVNIPRGVE